MSYKSKTNKSATEHASLNPKTGLNASGQQMGKGKRSEVVFRGEHQNPVSTHDVKLLSAHICPPPIFFLLSFLAVFYMLDPPVFSSAFKLPKTSSIC